MEGVGELRVVVEDRNFYRPLYNHTLQLKSCLPLFDFDFGLRLFTVISRKGRRVWRKGLESGKSFRAVFASCLHLDNMPLRFDSFNCTTSLLPRRVFRIGV